MRKPGGPSCGCHDVPDEVLPRCTTSAAFGSTCRESQKEGCGLPESVTLRGISGWETSLCSVLSLTMQEHDDCLPLWGFLKVSLLHELLEDEKPQTNATPAYAWDLTAKDLHILGSLIPL